MHIGSLAGYELSSFTFGCLPLREVSDRMPKLAMPLAQKETSVTLHHAVSSGPPSCRPPTRCERTVAAIVDLFSVGMGWGHRPGLCDQEWVARRTACLTRTY
jgi:hypothetical protein